MADLPVTLEGTLAERLAGIVDVEGKIPRALEALGPVADRDVLLLDGEGGLRARQLADLGARVTTTSSTGTPPIEAADGSADVIVSLWTGFRDDLGPVVAEARRVLRPGGRLLVLLDYGRDDVAQIRGDLPEHGLLSRRDGPFLRGGFKVRVVHCFWTFESLDDAASFLSEAFGESGASVAAVMKRPRLSYNVAIYHQTMGTPN